MVVGKWKHFQTIIYDLQIEIILYIKKNISPHLI